MDDKLLIKIIKIVKQTKKEIIKAFETKISDKDIKNSDEFYKILETNAKVLVDTIMKQSDTFSKDYINEDDMVNSVKKSIDSIDKKVDDIIEQYLQIKQIAVFEDADKLKKLLLIKAYESLLNSYILWCEKLELALFGEDTKAVINIDFTIDVELLKTIQNLSPKISLWRIAGIFGLGYILGDM